MKNPYMWFAAGVGGTALFFLLADGSLGTMVPLMFLLACPLMMIFMMRGMGSMHGQPPTGQPRENDASRQVHHTASSGDEPGDDRS